MCVVLLTLCIVLFSQEALSHSHWRSLEHGRVRPRSVEGGEGVHEEMLLCQYVCVSLYVYVYIH